ncbi:MAG: tetratricopeptide repeat protein [Sphingomonadales bacterium]|nr:tetratricopeptide repeat protein [Sphingomonadales bacterium]
MGPIVPSSMLEAKALAAVVDRIDGIQAQVDRMAAYIGSYATAASVLITILAVIITVALGLSAYFGFAVTRNNRLGRALRTSIDELDRKRQELEAIYDDRIAQLETQIGNYHDGLMSEVVARSGLMRELVAGELSYRRSDYHAALDHFGRVHELEPSNAEATYYLGRTLTNLDKLDEAITVFERLLATEPGDVRAMRGLALALRFRNADRARDVASAALALASIPADVRHDLHNEFALLLRDYGEHEKALLQHQAALVVRPGDTATEYFIGVAELLCGRLERGKARLKIARERARIELEDRALRPLWAAVIAWSAAFVQEDAGEADR